MDNPLVGSWSLVSWELRPTGGGESYYPLGKDVIGLLIYSQDGRMAVSFMKPGRAAFGSPMLLEGTPAEKIAAMESYASYTGRYEIQGDKVTHFVELSLFPNWVGTAQERFFKFDQGRLTLYTEPFVNEDTEQTAFALWDKIGKKR